MLFNGDVPVYGSPSVNIDFAKKEFNAYVSRVISYQPNDTIYMSSKSDCFITCKLDDFKLNYETGVISVPLENALLKALPDSKEKLAAFTEVKLKSLGFDTKPTLCYSGDGEEDEDEIEYEDGDEDIEYVGNSH